MFYTKKTTQKDGFLLLDQEVVGTRVDSRILRKDATSSNQTWVFTLFLASDQRYCKLPCHLSNPTSF